MDTGRVEARGDRPSRGPDLRERRPSGRLLTGLWAMPRGLALSLLLLLLFSCTSAGLERAPVVPSSVIELNPSERADEQRRSLTHVYYRNNALPPTPSARELRRVERDLERAPRIEVDELRSLFGNDLELLAYATRDTDEDGVLDFRISEYRGKFFEGDVDVDGDGIRNVYDAAPYDPRVGGTDTDGDGVPDKPGSFADRDGDGIPDHLDWSRPKGEAVAAVQTGLFHDFGVILVERSARYTPTIAEAVDDTMRLVFRESIPTLRTIAVEDQLLISPDLGDNGFMLGQTQTLTICVDSLAGAEPVVMLGLVIHEVGHAWQLAHDFDHHDLHAENKRMHFPPGSFTGSLTDFGWEVDANDIDERYHHRLYWPHFYATSPRYFYRGHAPNEWAAWFEDIQREQGADFLRTSPARTWGMVGPYSLTSPWEWHADNLMASVYNRMAQGIVAHPNHTYRAVAPLLEQRMLDTVQQQWSRFDYRNATGTGIDRELSATFELRPHEVQHLVDRYLVPLVDLPMIAEAMTLEPVPATEVSDMEGLGRELAVAWTSVRAQIDEPLQHVPSLNRLAQAGIEPWRDRGPKSAKPRATAKPTAALDTDPGELELELEFEDGTAEDATTDVPALDDTASTELAAAPPTSRPALRDTLEHAADSQLGTRHGAGRVGGVYPELPPTDTTHAPLDIEVAAETPDPDVEAEPGETTTELVPTAIATRSEVPELTEPSSRDR